MDTEHRKFAQSVIDNIKKNGFPEKKVSFPLVQLYERAEAKGVNLNKVLETLEGIEICHEKTPERIVFFPKPREEERAKATPDPAKIAERISAMIPHLARGGVLPGLDASGLSASEAQAMAMEMLGSFSAEQMGLIKNVLENLTDEQRAALIEMAEKSMPK